MDIITKNVQLLHGDCLEILCDLISKGVKVDAIITDPPFGTTGNAWDKILPYDTLWELLRMVATDSVPFVLFGNEPFSSHLRMSNMKFYKYDWIWEKHSHSNPFLAKKQPLRILENIMVFYKKQPVYNYGGEATEKVNWNCTSENYGAREHSTYRQTHTGYPKNIIKFKHDDEKLHPTQKPVALMEYLIKTYTNEGGLVLDFTMGSGSTGGCGYEY